MQIMSIPHPPYFRMQSARINTAIASVYKKRSFTSLVILEFTFREKAK